jgi:hypothetical protein
VGVTDDPDTCAAGCRRVIAATSLLCSLLYRLQPLTYALLVNAKLPSCRSPAHALDVDKGHGLFLLQRVAVLQQIVTV